MPWENETAPGGEITQTYRKPRVPQNKTERLKERERLQALANAPSFRVAYDLCVTEEEKQAAWARFATSQEDPPTQSDSPSGASTSSDHAPTTPLSESAPEAAATAGDTPRREDSARVRVAGDGLGKLLPGERYTKAAAWQSLDRPVDGP
jgi:hypothetical protein